VGDLPHVAVGVGEGAGVATPVGADRLTDDRPPGALGLGQDGVDFLG